MNISIFGTGYVGLVTACCFASKGYQVLCFDTDLKKIAQLQQGQSSFYEPDLNNLLQRGLQQKKLSFSTDIQETIAYSDYLFLCLPTPSNTDGTANTDAIFQVANHIVHFVFDTSKIIINKSTAPVGTGKKLSDLFQHHQKHHLQVVINPEFLREGSAVEDFFNPHLVVLGGEDARSLEAVKTLYKHFYIDESRYFLMNMASAELSKYTLNAFLATKISFINEIANFGVHTEANIEEVTKAIGADPRIGPLFLNPGLGYGGSCLPKDTKALILQGTQLEEGHFQILRAVEKVNTFQVHKIFHCIQKYFKTPVDKTLAFWGGAFKPGTDDIRQAPAITLIKELQKEGYKIKLFDPKAMAPIRALFPDLIFCKDPYESVIQADAVVIATEWPIFKQIDFHRVKSSIRNPVIFDGRCIYDRRRISKMGFYYYCFGSNI